MKYSMLIQWSDEDQAYVVSLPEWEAVRQGEELIENLIAWAQQDGSPMPAPRVFAESVS
jgi:predicted RNase H-like HicB family nuclease